MKGLSCVLVASFVFASCGGTQPEEQATETAEGPSYQSHANLAQLMQAIPFPASNIIFDAGNEDPEAAQKEGADPAASGAQDRYSSLYGGWTEVENASLALAETANLLRVPGRMCRNGRPAPIEQENWQRFTQGLADAGLASYKAALTKNLDEMLIVGGTVTEACAACHEVYRDVPNEEDRCMVPAATSEAPEN